MGDADFHGVFKKEQDPDEDVSVFLRFDATDDVNGWWFTKDPEHLSEDAALGFCKDTLEHCRSACFPKGQVIHCPFWRKNKCPLVTNNLQPTAMGV